MVRRFAASFTTRLNVFAVLLPPLRARRKDFHDLVWHFVEKFGLRMGKRVEPEHIPADTMSALTQNVRVPCVRGARPSLASIHPGNRFQVSVRLHPRGTHVFWQTQPGIDNFDQKVTRVKRAC
jgi:hypothetical protein